MIMKKGLLLFCFLVFTAVTAYANVQLVEMGSVYKLPMNDIQDIVVENTDVVCMSSSNNYVEIVPLKLGRTYLYTWNKSGQQTIIPLRIVSKGYSDQLTLQERQLQKQKKNPDSFKVKLNYVGGSSRNQLNNATYDNSFGVYQLRFLGGSDLGQYDSFFQFEQQNTLNALVMASFQLQNKDYSLSVGDSWTQISPLLTNYLHYQGAQLSNLDILGMKVLILGGGTNQYFWGQDIWRQSSNKNRFAGLQIKKDLFDKKLNVYLNTFYVQNTDNQVVQNSYGLASLGGTYQFLPTLTFNGEAALQTNQSKAFFANAVFQDKALYFSMEGKLIDSSFSGISNYAITDTQGVFNTLSYALGSGFKLYGKWNGYKRPSIADAFVYERNVGIQFEKDRNLPKVDLSYWDLDRRNMIHGGSHYGYQIYASQSLYYLPSTFYVNYRPFYFSDDLSPSLNVDTAVMIMGLNNNIFGIVNAVIEQTQEMPKVLNATQAGTLYSLQLYSNQLSVLDCGFLALKMDMSSKYEKHYQNGNNDYNLYYGNATLRIKQEWVDDIYINYIKQIKTSGGGISNEDTNFRVGVQTMFDTGIQLKDLSYKVSGIVFEDTNRNGKLDPDEKGLSGFKVTNADNNMTTRDDGSYELNVLDNPYLSFATAKYTDYQIHINNPYQITHKEGQRNIRVDVPVTFAKTIDVIVYFDANNNGVYDDGFDQLLPNSMVILSDRDGNIIKKAVLATGRESFDISSKQEIYFSVDLNTVPNGVVPVNPDELKLSASKAKNNEICFPFIIK